MIDEKDELCKNLVYFRKKNNLTQVDLAKKLGYSNKNISKWETGEITPDIFLLYKLSQIYGITIDELITGEKPTNEKLLTEEINKNKKMKHRIIFLAIVLFCFVVLGICAIISTIISSSADVNNYRWIVYLYGLTISSVPLYIYFKTVEKRHIIAILLLVLFLVSMSTSIFFSTNCSPWIFLIVLPLFCVIYFYTNLMDAIIKYKKFRHQKK